MSLIWPGIRSRYSKARQHPLLAVKIYVILSLNDEAPTPSPLSKISCALRCIIRHASEATKCSSSPAVPDELTTKYLPILPLSLSPSEITHFPLRSTHPERTYLP